MKTVIARARTRGKSPVEFVYQAVGKLIPRTVKGKDGEDLKREDGSIIYVDDVDVTGLVYDEAGDVRESALDECLSLFGGNLGKLLEYGFAGRNEEARRAAAPVTETVTEDELTPIVDILVAAGILSRSRVVEGKTEPLDEVRNWRRAVSTGAKQIEMSLFDYAMLTKEVKAARKAGIELPTEAQ